MGTYVCPLLAARLVAELQSIHRYMSAVLSMATIVLPICVIKSFKVVARPVAPLTQFELVPDKVKLAKFPEFEVTDSVV